MRSIASKPARAQNLQTAQGTQKVRLAEKIAQKAATKPKTAELADASEQDEESATPDAPLTMETED